MKQPKSALRRKQRKAHFTAPPVERAKRMSGHLSHALRSEWGFRSFPLSINDSVIVKKGKFKGKEGIVVDIKADKYQVFVEGCIETNKEGESVQVPIQSSTLEIVKFSTDSERAERLERKKQSKIAAI